MFFPLCLAQLFLIPFSQAYPVECLDVEINGNTSCHIDHYNTSSGADITFTLQQKSCTDFEENLIFHNTILTHIPAGICLKFVAMQYMDISYTGITQILWGNFGSCCPLLRLNVSHNNLEELTERCFVGAPNLQIIDLSFNGISVISKDAFVSLEGLRTIDLSNNHIKSVPSDIFYDNQNLIELNMEYNYLNVLDEFFYKMLSEQKSLKILNLNHNNLTYNDLNKLPGLHNFKELRINQNNLNNSTANEIEFSLKNLEQLWHILDKFGFHAGRGTKINVSRINNVNISMTIENSSYIQDFDSQRNTKGGAAITTINLFGLTIIIILSFVRQRSPNI